MVEKSKVAPLQLELGKLKTSTTLNDHRESESGATETAPTRSGRPSESVKAGMNHEFNCVHRDKDKSFNSYLDSVTTMYVQVGQSNHLK